MAQRYAVIANGVVENVALADAAFASEQGWVAAPDHVGPGWGYDGKTFSAPKPSISTAAQWAAVRAERNALLAFCDWTQLSDAPVDAAAWAAYRQALRDITQQSDPFAIAWPTAPAA